MGVGSEPTDGGVTRRQVLAGSAAAAAGSAGCLGQVESFLGTATPEQLSLEIKTLPADEDETATRIARLLTKRLTAVGIDAEIELLPAAQLWREVHVGHDFDLYVGGMPIGQDPDFLRPLLHSQYTEDSGWQNPFGLADLELDELLTSQQQQAGSTRVETVGEIQHTVAREQPFTPLVAEQAIAAVGTDRFSGWSTFPARDPLWILGLQPTSGDASRPQHDRTLTIATTDGSLTRSFNPLTDGFGVLDMATALLYDPLVRYYDDGFHPWLAESLRWNDAADEQLTLRLREDLRWHDGTPLTAEDVAFTLSFLSDTTLDSTSRYAPAPKYRARTDLFRSVRVVDDQVLRIAVDGSEPLATWGLTVPPLPKHIWAERTGLVDADRGVTEALATDNLDPVGSGPLAFESRSAGERATLTAFADHPVNREYDSMLTRRFEDLAVTELTFLVAPSDVTAINHVELGEADVTAATLGSENLSRIRDRDALSTVVSESRQLYHLGFNSRAPPLHNPNLRRAIARLLDKGEIAETVFDGFGTPMATPLVDAEWVPVDLQWTGVDPEVPFAGSDGELDVESAREYFREAGFRYTDRDRLVYR